jgi:hypothetical protein
MSTLTSKSNSVKVPAGKYWLGDPCYVIESDDWSKVCEAFFADENQGKSVVQVDLGNGNLVVLCNTAWGDGEFRSSKGHILPVDSGTIGLVSLAYDPEFKSNFDLCSEVEFSVDTTVDNFGGIMYFGTIRVDTKGEDE